MRSYVFSIGILAYFDDMHLVNKVIYEKNSKVKNLQTRTLNSKTLSF